MTHRSGLRFATALVAVIGISTQFATSAVGSTLCVTPWCDLPIALPDPPPVTIPLGPIVSVWPGFSPLRLLAPRDESGMYDYGFVAGFNVPKSISLPFFSDSAIQIVKTPADWALSIDPTNDAFGLGHSAGLMTWTTSTPTPAEVGLFEFKSPYGPTETQAVAVMWDGSTSNATLEIPLSPQALAAGFVATSAPIPEPSSGWLALAGLVALAALRRTSY